MDVDMAIQALLKLLVPLVHKPSKDVRPQRPRWQVEAAHVSGLFTLLYSSTHIEPPQHKGQANTAVFRCFEGRTHQVKLRSRLLSCLPCLLEQGPPFECQKTYSGALSDAWSLDWRSTMQLMPTLLSSHLFRTLGFGFRQSQTGVLGFYCSM